MSSAVAFSLMSIPSMTRHRLRIRPSLRECQICRSDPSRGATHREQERGFCRFVSHRWPHAAAAFADDAVQFHGSNCSSLVIGVSAMRARTLASQACGSTSLSLAVYADRRTMPSTSSNIPVETRFSRRFGWRLVIDTRHSSHAQRAFRNSRSRSFGRNRSALAGSYGFSFASADSFSSRCA